jgi:short subunit dehydrogenase-like uncharacterized protein
MQMPPSPPAPPPASGGNNNTNNNAAREYDLIVFGATGFTGSLAAKYLKTRYGKTKLKYALGGRDYVKLRKVAEENGSGDNSEGLTTPPDVFVATTPEQLRAVTEKAKVVLSFAGPFAKFGFALTEACVDTGTHYADITGEPPFIRRCVSELHEKAKARKTCVVNCVGYDSIPWDLGSWAVAQSFKTDGFECERAEAHAGRSKGGVSGGTIASAAGVITDNSMSELKAMGDPFYCVPELCRDGSRPLKREIKEKWRLQNDSRLDEATGKYTMPSIMAGINSKVVARSYSLLRDADKENACFAEDFSYGESDFCKDESKAKWGARGFKAFGVLFAIPPTRWLLRKTVLPAPGQGPSLDILENGYSNVYVVGHGRDKKDASKKIEPRVAHFEFKDADPGYKGTAALAVEAALCLSLSDKAPGLKTGGCLTPSVALGETLIERLRDAPNFSFSVSALKGKELKI